MSPKRKRTAEETADVVAAASVAQPDATLEQLEQQVAAEEQTTPAAAEEPSHPEQSTQPDVDDVLTITIDNPLETPPNDVFELMLDARVYDFEALKSAVKKAVDNMLKKKARRETKSRRADANVFDF